MGIRLKARPKIIDGHLGASSNGNGAAPEKLRKTIWAFASSVRSSRRVTHRAVAALALSTGVCFALDARARDDGERVALSERIEVDDASLYVEVRGEQTDAPLLIWLHGGPGGAERPLFRYFNGDLESSFLVAYLDQRGAGQSFDADALPSRLTIAQHLADLDHVVDHLRGQFGRECVLLIGHSWGTVLAILYAKAHPEKVSAVICVAPVVSFSEQWTREYAYDLAEATRRGDEAALERLREIGPPPYGDADPVMRLQRVTERYRGVQYQSHNRWTLVAEGILRGLITPCEFVRIIRGSRQSLAAMHQELSEFDMRRQVTSLEVPTYFLLGRHDHHVDANLAREYFESLSAPRKEVYWFEQSAHDVPFDEPSLFNARVTSIGQTSGGWNSRTDGR